MLPDALRPALNPSHLKLTEGHCSGSDGWKHTRCLQMSTAQCLSLHLSSVKLWAQLHTTGTPSRFASSLYSSQTFCFNIWIYLNSIVCSYLLWMPRASCKYPEVTPHALAPRKRSWKHSRDSLVALHDLHNSLETCSHDSYLYGSQPLRQVSFYQHMSWPLTLWHKRIPHLHSSVGIPSKASAQAGVHQTWQMDMIPAVLGKKCMRK